MSGARVALKRTGSVNSLVWHAFFRDGSPTCKIEFQVRDGLLQVWLPDVKMNLGPILFPMGDDGVIEIDVMP